MRSLTLGTFFKLKTTVSTFGIVCYAAMAIVAAWLAGRWLSLSPTPALLAGVLTALAFFVSGWMHQFGHALAARRTGYPMTGLHFFSLFSASQYPRAEPPLPPQIHLRRALGGFWINLLIGAILAITAWAVWGQNGVAAWVAAATAFWNLAVLGLGALVPVEFRGVFSDDGASILKYWRESRKQ